MNPLKNNNQLNYNIQQIKNMMRKFNIYNNPELAIQQLAQNNPQFNNIMQMCNGKNPKDVFYSMAKEMGVDPEQIINMLKF